MENGKRATPDVQSSASLQVFDTSADATAVPAFVPDAVPLQEPSAAAPVVPDAKRGTAGRVGTGNTLALKSGRYSRLVQEDAAPWRAAEIAAIRADLGDDIATLKGHTVEQAGHLLVILQHLGGNLMAVGPLTGKGRQRAAMTAYLQVLDRYLRIVQLLGLERRTRQLPNPVDWIEGRT